MIDELNVAYLELPYSVEDSAISMFVYLPIENTPTAVDELLSKFSVKTIHEALTAGSVQEVDVEFPKISLDGSYLLAQVNQIFTYSSQNKKTQYISFCRDFVVRCWKILAFETYLELWLI